MGLLTIIRKAKRREKQMRILMVGLDNAGKTTVVKRINGDDISDVSPTLGFNISTLHFKGYSLNMWDVGGQKSIRSYWRNYFEATDGLIWVVDSADWQRMGDCRQELHSLLLEERLSGASLLVLANKQDMAGAMSAAEISKALSLELLPRSRRHSHLQSCSAVTGDGLEEGFQWLIDDIAARLYRFD